LLLTRQGLAYLSSIADQLCDEQVRAVELELATVGYVLSSRLRARLSRVTLEELVAFRERTLSALVAHAGFNFKHEPLFPSFPEGIPEDTLELWWKKVLVHFLQAEGQPCISCGQVGTTHVLDPCAHVVCDRWCVTDASTERPTARVRRANTKSTGLRRFLGRPPYGSFPPSESFSRSSTSARASTMGPKRSS
jgi:hypothetical protein